MNVVSRPDGAQIFYKDWGTGPPVVLSHGWPLNADSWDSQMLFLASHGYRCVAHDRRGPRPLHTDVARQRDGHLRRRPRAPSSRRSTCATPRSSASPPAAARSPATSAATAPPASPESCSSAPCRRSWCSAPTTPAAYRSRCSTRSAPARSPTARSCTATSPTDRSSATTGPAPTSRRASRDAFWLQGLQSGHRNAYECIAAFSETDFRDDLAQFDVPTLVIHGDDDQVVPFAVGGQASAALDPGRRAEGLPGRTRTASPTPTRSSSATTCSTSSRHDRSHPMRINTARTRPGWRNVIALLGAAAIERGRALATRRLDASIGPSHSNEPPRARPSCSSTAPSPTPPAGTTSRAACSKTTTRSSRPPTRCARSTPTPPTSRASSTRSTVPSSSSATPTAASS